MIRHAVLALALTALAALPAAAASVADEMAAPYLHAQTALANDSIEGVPAAAAVLASAADALGAPAAAIAAAARGLAEAPDLQAAREAFGPLSDALIAYAEEVGFGELRVAFCPMVKKSWIQKPGELRNPFYGSMMLTCGSFTR